MSRIPFWFKSKKEVKMDLLYLGAGYSLLLSEFCMSSSVTVGSVSPVAVDSPSVLLAYSSFSLSTSSPELGSSAYSFSCSGSSFGVVLLGSSGWRLESSV